jgi:tRNA dimethylallyltransferase
VLVAIVGATGTGKSALSLDIAVALGDRGHPAEIVNADAMQLYRGMDIGTAKLPMASRRDIPHHMFDVLDVADEASVADYQVRARAAISDIQERGSVPILVGGSGLYVSSVIYDFRFPGTDPAIRERLEAELVERGPGALHQQLKALDADAANAIGPSNGRRLVRALEVIEITGEPFGSGLPDESSFSQPTTVIGVSAPRPILVERLDARVEQMWTDGLLDEVRRIGTSTMGVTASRAIGYSQAIAQIEERMSQAEAIEQTAALTRRYARRQVGWFRRYPATTWVDSDDPHRVQVSLDRIGL